MVELTERLTRGPISVNSTCTSPRCYAEELCFRGRTQSRVSLSRGDDGLHRFALRFHPDMAVMTKHLAIDMPGDLHDGFVAGAAFGQFCDEGVPVIVPSTLYLCLFCA